MAAGKVPFQEPMSGRIPNDLLLCVSRRWRDENTTPGMIDRGEACGGGAWCLLPSGYDHQPLCNLQGIDVTVHFTAAGACESSVVSSSEALEELRLV